MELMNFRIEKCIFHEIIPPSGEHDYTTAKIAESCFNITTTIEEEIIKRILAVMGSNTDDSIEFVLDQTCAGDVFKEVKTLSGLDDDHYTQATGRIAHILAEVQGKNTKMLTGPLLVITGLVGSDDHRYACIIKADFTSGLKEGDQNDIQKIEKIFLTPEKDFYKVALILERNPSAETRDADTNFQFFVYDKNVTTHSEGVAKYFYHDFLGLKVPETDALKTKNFFNETLSFINQRDDIKADDKVAFTTHLYSYLLKPTQNTVNSHTFANTYFSDDEQKKDFKKIINSLGLSSFGKDLGMIGTKLNKRRLTFTNGFNLSLDASFMQENIAISTDEEKQTTTLVINGIIKHD